MYFYNKEGKRLNYAVSDPIGGEMYGNIYKISDDVCLKYTKEDKQEMKKY